LRLDEFGGTLGRMRDPVKLFFIGVAVLMFSLAASCATGAQTAAAIGAVGASAAAIIEAIAPMLPPESLAKLQLAAASIDGTVQATATAVSTIADAIAQLKTNVGSQFAEQAKGLQAAVVQLGSMPSREEVYLASGGAAAAGTAASRIMSRIKHAAAKA
jgi:hypothetical protein